MDLLNPEKPPILVFEDRGRIQFKGLSQVLVKSIAEFQNLYSYACFALKGAPKKGGCEHVRRSHMGLIVHVFSQNGSLVSKVNFVDLAGYEDARKKSSDGSYLAEIKNYTHATGFVKNPSFCQDTIYMVSLASWSCHWICRAFLDSTKRNASSAKQMETYKQLILRGVVPFAH
ncbi:kinesin-like protein KIN-10C isoform X2 [Glycine soja]|uniref:kinesin-like protein KIN-10C isoform X2 n=1 Tax=Glycine soja TaxID=3848 RepID=UPI00103F90DD|nr:kinesin-like protein KIN-10C isoform X2 [Glycine soja]XP_028209240.1 kinesin-like protein KIN-10C isoform X2 [Glycine soja]